MNRARLFCLCGIVILVIVFAVPARTQSRRRIQPHPKSDEPFRSFHVIDRDLSVLEQQFNALQNSLAQHPKGDASNGATWSRSAQEIIGTARSVKALTGPLERRYARHRFGARMFRDMQTKAKVVTSKGDAVSRAPDAAAARAAVAPLQASILDLVLQYNRISGGYAALSCTKNQWTCCEPKHDSSGPGRPDSCRWLCTSNANKCTGFLGPRVVAE